MDSRKKARNLKLLDGFPRNQVTDPHPTRFVGTATEIEVAMRRFYDAQRAYVKGCTLVLGDDGEPVMEDGKYVTDDRYEPMLDEMERCIWQVDITPLDGLAKTRCRHAFVVDAERIRTERDLYEMLGRGQLAKYADEDTHDDE